MNKKSKKTLWIVWIISIVLLSSYLGFQLYQGQDKSIFMPGALTSGHHQIGVKCDACHGEAFSDPDAMQETCVSCHGEQRKKPQDSHPRNKFTDPRNADMLEKINALYCVSCHQEHRPDSTDEFGMTQPKDICLHCHEKIAEDRPSHKGLAFDTCASAGCHNFHNNRSLYTDFLLKHAKEPNVLEKALVPEREFANVLDEIITYPHAQYPVKILSIAALDKTELTHGNNDIHYDWQSTAHAKSGVTCNACHLTKGDTEEKSIWQDKPTQTSCSTCHDVEVSQFMQGKHGMRLKQGLSPMTPDMARLPMNPSNKHEQLTCNSCHKAHKDDTQSAAVEACLGCHTDQHSVNYKQSKHYTLWLKERSAELPKGSGVTCATCHMPRIPVDVNDWLRRTVVQHNQNATLKPNEKMIRPACLHCHGLPFSIDALADKNLIEQNFNGLPTIHIKSVDMAIEDQQRYLKETGELNP